MNEKDVKKYIFRLQKNGREKLLHCIMISRKDPMKALQEAEKEAVNKGIILKIHKKEKLQDTPEFPKILKSRQRVMLLKLITILRILKKIRNGNLLVYILTKV